MKRQVIRQWFVVERCKKEQPYAHSWCESRPTLTPVADAGRGDEASGWMAGWRAGRTISQSTTACAHCMPALTDDARFFLSSRTRADGTRQKWRMAMSSVAMVSAVARRNASRWLSSICWGRNIGHHYFNRYQPHLIISHLESDCVHASTLQAWQLGPICAL